MSDLLVAGRRATFLAAGHRDRRLADREDGHPLNFLDGRVLVEHDLEGRGTLALAMDLAARAADPVYPQGIRLTEADDYLFAGNCRLAGW